MQKPSRAVDRKARECVAAQAQRRPCRLPVSATPPLPPAGQTVLAAAAGSGSTELVQYLLQHGADLNAKDDSGSTPIHWACRGGEARACAAAPALPARRPARQTCCPSLALPPMPRQP